MSQIPCPTTNSTPPLDDPSKGVILFHLKGTLQGNRLAITRRRFAAAR